MPDFRFRDIVHSAVGAFVLSAALLMSPMAQASGPDSPSEPHAGTELVLRALSLLGVNYRFGGTSPDTGLDCSGLVRHVFREAMGVVLPRRAEEMSQTGASVDTSQLAPGDLVFFNTLRRTFSHVGIYIGNGQFVHAPSSGGGVRIEHLSKQYWTQRFNGARRLVAESLGVDGLTRAAGRSQAAAALAQAAAAIGPSAIVTPVTLPLTGAAVPKPNPIDLLQIPQLYIN
ncbi:MAG: C40 family peptidase [Burkholderiaceae bacterium]|nr:C40 family peptidase [Burkholderiaceae bacterium]